MNTNSIKFYSVTEAYGDFSNFALYPIQLKGKTWATSEHYFQAQKFKGTPHENKIRKASNPMQAALLGRTRKVKLRPDWEKVKDAVMLDAVRAKFAQHNDLKNYYFLPIIFLLLNTLLTMLIGAMEVMEKVKISWDKY